MCCPKLEPVRGEKKKIQAAPTKQKLSKDSFQVFWQAPRPPPPRKIGVGCFHSLHIETFSNWLIHMFLTRNATQQMTSPWSDINISSQPITNVFLVDAETPHQVLTSWVRPLIASIFDPDPYGGAPLQEFERAIFAIRILAMFCTLTNYQKRWAILRLQH